MNDYSEIPVQYPYIVSASRSTDIPAFFADWFFNRLAAGFSIWKNPFNGKEIKISYADTRFIVFWSKNPKPLLQHLDKLQARNIDCYIQFTFNDYVKEKYEQKVPSVDNRLETFHALAEKLGPERLIWRFDPLILTDKVDLDDLLGKIEYLGDRLYKKTHKLVFSYVNISTYPSVKRNMDKAGIKYQEWNQPKMMIFAKELAELNQKWDFKLATCAEEIDLTQFKIFHNKCIDDELIIKLAYRDKKLMDYLGVEIKRFAKQQEVQGSLLDLNVQQNNSSPSNLPSNVIKINDELYALKQLTRKTKDSGQRTDCGCIKSKDIGQYNTCIHGCVYCYANHDLTKVRKNFAAYQANKNGVKISV